MNYRLGTIEDLQVLIDLRIAFLNEITNGGQIWKESIVARELRSYLLTHIGKDGFISWLAIDDNKIVATGYICFHHYLPGYEVLNGWQAYIFNVYVLPAYRLRGLAGEIMQKLMKEAADRNITAVTLHTTPMARALYEKLGFKPRENAMDLDPTLPTPGLTFQGK